MSNLNKNIVEIALENKAPSAALALTNLQKKSIVHIKYSRSLSKSQRVFRVEPIITITATQYGA